MIDRPDSTNTEKRKREKRGGKHLACNVQEETTDSERRQEEHPPFFFSPPWSTTETSTSLPSAVCPSPDCEVPGFSLRFPRRMLGGWSGEDRTRAVLPQSFSGTNRRTGSGRQERDKEVSRDKTKNNCSSSMSLVFVSLFPCQAGHVC